MTDSGQNLQNIRHSLAHLLAAAVLELYPNTKHTIGPSTDNGFYYDFDFEKPIGEDALPKVEARMREILPSWQEFNRREISPDEAHEFFKDNPYKRELIDEIIEKREVITLYTSCPADVPLKTSDCFTDLCRGGHTDDLGAIDPESFALSHVAGAYWRGSEKNKMLTRIYGLAFNSKKELEAYKAQQEEAKKRDHKKLGRELDLFVNSELVGKGLPLLTPKGATIYRELERFIVDEEIKRGYLHVYTPDIARIALYEKSGHYPHYKDSMYAPITIDDEQFMLRPMTCPHHYELYSSRPRSYRELPMRIAEVARLYRYEQSGELAGLIRNRSFDLADAHIICADEAQAMEEVSGALDLIEYVAGVFGLAQGEHYWYRLSLGNRADAEKYYENDAAWNDGENRLRELLEKRGCNFVEAKGEAAFYGPKIDIQMRNVNGKEDTAFTVQYDFCMPDRFALSYIDTDGKEKRPFVVHRSSIGSLQRSLAFLIEHYAGAFPLWLAPVQVKILPIGEAHATFAEEVYTALRDAGIRVELDESGETLGKKIREWKLAKIPYALVIGDKEIETKKVTVESRDKEEKEILSIEELIEKLEKRLARKGEF